MQEKPKRPLIAVVLEGGVVQSVVIDGAFPEIDLLIVDYDTEDSFDEDNSPQRLAQDSGESVDAYISDCEMQRMSPVIAEDLRHWLEHGVTKSDQEAADAQ